MAAARRMRRAQGTEHTNTYGGSTAHAAGGGTEHTNTYGGSTSGAYGAGRHAHVRLSRATAYHPPAITRAIRPIPPITRRLRCRTTRRPAPAAPRRPAPSSAWPPERRWLPPTRRPRHRTPTPQASLPAAPTRPRRPVPPTTPAWPPARPPQARLPAGPTRWASTTRRCRPASMTINKNGTTYYLSGNTWFQPAYGANGVYYRVVPTP